MKGDFSRLPLDPAAPGTGVWMQQGRVQLDADWNEQVALSASRARALARDAMGGSGAPARDPGFEVTLRSALRLDGARTEAVVWNADGPGFDPCAPFTLEVRVAVRAGGAGTLVDRAGRYALSVSADGSITLRLGGSPPDGVRGEPDGSAAAHRDRLTAPRALPLQRPAWVAAVYDGASGCIYVDGELAATGPLRARAPSRGDDAPLTLGGAVCDGVPQRVVDGVLLEARVWGTARTPAQVRAGAARAPLPGTRGLAAWWPLDEGHGGWARDASGNGFDAELGGGGTDAPRWLEPSLFIGAGRYWVEGVGCENAREVPWSAQPSLPGARAPRRRADALVYLEVWDRYLSAAEDPSLREVALAGGDTTGRTRTVWQVRAVELSRDERGEDEEEARDPRGEDWSRHLPAPCGDGRMAALGTTVATDNRLYRVEVRGGGGAYGWPRPPAAWANAVPVADVRPGEGEVRLDGSAAERDGWRPGQWVELFSRATDAADTAGTLHRVLRVADAEGGARLTLDPPPPPVPAAAHPRLRPVATFVWSTDNGSSAWAVQALDVVGGTAVLDDGGRAGQLPVPGEWVEATDDAHALRGIPGPLCRVDRVDGATLSVDLQPAPAGVSGDPRHHPVLRRWDPGPGAGTGAERVVRGGGWLQLDGTVSVRFDAGGYRTGDWWTVPVREGAPTGIEWPAGPAGPAALPPQGITRHAAPLALVRHRHGRTRVHDLRQLLSPAHSGDFVRRTGPEWMTGPLHVHGDVAVGGALRARLVDGSVGMEQLAHHAVTTRAIEDGAVTEEKLAPGAVDWAALSPGVRDAINPREQPDPNEEGPSPHVPTLNVGHGPPAGAVILTVSRVPPPGHAALEGALAVPVATPEWRAVDALPLKELPGAVCAALEGALYVLSGTAAELWRWWPEGGAWEPLNPPSRQRRGGALCGTGGRLYLLGGTDASQNPVAAADAFDPATGAWESLAPLPTARAWLGAAELEGRVYAVGGRGERMALGHASAAVEAYDPAAERWASCRDMHLARVHPSVASAAGEVYAVGGAGRVHLGAGRTATSESYDPAADRWTRRPRLPLARMQGAVAALQDRLYVAGGREDDAAATADSRRLDPGAGTWVRFPPIPGPLRGPSAAGLDGVLYLVGGAGEQGAPSALLHACRLFTPLYPHRRED